MTGGVWFARDCMSFTMPVPAAGLVADLWSAARSRRFAKRVGKELRRWLLETPGGFITPMGVPTTALIHWAPRQGAG